MAGWTAAAIVGGAYLGSQASKKAGETQAGAAREASALSNEQYQQTREDQAPYREAGYRALGTLERTAGNVPGAFKFGAGDYQADPGYAFRLSEGQKALDRTAAARGGLISGSALKAATRFGQDMGSQEYQNAYNRALTGYNTGVASENQLYNRQAGLAGIGQTATNLVGQAGAANAATMGNYLTGGAAASAAGQVGQANAFNQGLSTYLNYNQGNNLMNALNANRYGTNYGQFTPGSNAFVGPMPI
jgi:hypothetical protein